MSETYLILFFRVPNKEYNIRTEPKFIVFFTQLLTLFQICRACKSDKTLVEVNSYGTTVEVKTVCVNPDCGKQTKWFLTLLPSEENCSWKLVA